MDEGTTISCCYGPGQEGVGQARFFGSRRAFRRIGEENAEIEKRRTCIVLTQVLVLDSAGDRT
jgi:hypothetical protein